MAVAAAAPGGMVRSLGCGAKSAFFDPAPIHMVEKRRCKSCSPVVEKSRTTESSPQVDGVAYDPDCMNGLATRVDMLRGERGRQLLQQGFNAEHTSPNPVENAMTERTTESGIESIPDQPEPNREMLARLGFQSKVTFLDPVPISMFAQRKCRSCSPVMRKARVAQSSGHVDGVTCDPKYMLGLAARVDMLRGERGRQLLQQGLNAEHTSPNPVENAMTERTAECGIESIPDQTETNREMLARLGFQSKVTFLDPVPISMFAQRKCRSCSPVMRKARAAQSSGHVDGVTCDPKYMLGLAVRVDMLRGERGRPFPSQSPGAEQKLLDMHGNPLTKIMAAVGNGSMPGRATSRHRLHRSVRGGDQTATRIGDKITLMIRHIPYAITYERLKQAVDDAGFAGLYFRIWIPPSLLAQLGPQRFSNRGYGFIKFVDNRQAAARFVSAFDGYQFENCQCQRSCEVVLAHVQD